MDALALLHRAQEVGLRVEPMGDKLLVRGPKRAEAYQHGKRWPTWQCAGCDALISGSQPLNLPDGNRVHFEPIDCLIRFGKRWRGAACEALIASGLEPPGLDGDQL